MRVWWTDDTTFDIDLRTGVYLTITRKEGDTVYTMTGEYPEVNRLHRLKHTIAMPQFSPNSNTITIDITENVNGGCIITFMQTGEDISSELSELPAGSNSESEKGWQQMFNSMEAVWEKAEDNR